jgi:2-iminobutanoate/2-iminopropanoate deaminase
MEKTMQHHLSPNAPQPGGPYSHAVSAGGLLYLSGQRPQHPVTNVIPEGVVAQAQQVFANLGAVLESCGCTFADVVKVSVFLADIDDFDAFNNVYREFFAAPYPSRTTIACVLRGISVEVDLVAALPSPTPALA